VRTLARAGPPRADATASELSGQGRMLDARACPDIVGHSSSEVGRVSRSQQDVHSPVPRRSERQGENAGAGQQFVDDDELAQHVAVIEAGFPRYDIVAEDMVAEDDKVVVRTTFRGTHAGEFVGIAPTRRQVTVPYIIIYRVRGDKIVAHWVSIDMLSFMQQLGVAPEPAAAQ
jgi:predicted ester cyclase